MKILSRLVFLSIVLQVVLQVALVGAQDTDLDPGIAKWEKDIAKLEGLNLIEPKVPQAILYYGSSSIRLWEGLPNDMAPWPAIKRGYGGAKLPDVIHYAPGIIGPHLGEKNPDRCRAVVLFVANDITGRDNDAAPSEVADRFSRLHQWIRKQDATIPVFWIEVTPTLKRWSQWPKIAEATKRIGQVIDTDANTHLIATAGAYLGLDGRPRAELFMEDKLHLNEAGYQLWAGLIKAQLHLKLGAAVPWQAIEAEPAEAPEAVIQP